MSNGYVIPFEDKLKCSICQDRIKDVRSLSCGHTYCKTCLDRSAQTTYPRNVSIKCAECQKTSQIPYGGVDGLPRCYILNSLIDDINQTFGPDGSNRTVAISRNGFQARETFKCSICIDLMMDARYLPCGHSFCKGCLIKQPQHKRGSVRCCKCLRDHALPSGGIAGLPASYRINSIVAELKANEKVTSPPVTPSLPSTSGLCQPNGHFRYHQSQRTSRTMMEDVEEAKRRAQARARPMQVLVKPSNGKTITIDVNADDTVLTLKKKIQRTIGIAPSQQQLVFNSQNLYDNKTLSEYGITNLSTIQVNGRLRGGSSK